MKSHSQTESCEVTKHTNKKVDHLLSALPPWELNGRPEICNQFWRAFFLWWTVGFMQVITSSSWSPVCKTALVTNKNTDLPALWQPMVPILSSGTVVVSMALPGVHPYKLSSYMGVYKSTIKSFHDPSFPYFFIPNYTVCSKCLGVFPFSNHLQSQLLTNNHT